MHGIINVSVNRMLPTPRSSGMNNNRLCAAVVIFLAASFGCSALAHRQHYSWTKISWGEQEGRLEIEHRIHQHDAILLLRNQSGFGIDITEAEQQAKYALYVSDHFQLSYSDVTFELTLLGAELIGQYLMVYQEISLNSRPVALTIESNILMETFTDQINVVDIKIGDWKDTVNLTQKSKTIQVQFTQTSDTANAHSY